MDCGKTAAAEKEEELLTRGAIKGIKGSKGVTPPGLLLTDM